MHKMSLQKRLVIFIGYESPSIIKYLKPLTEDLYMARYVDCHFNESIYTILGGENKQLKRR